MTVPVDTPSWRKPAGMLAILIIIALWAAIVLAAAPAIVRLAAPLQALFYLIAGTAWIAPLRPLLRWMEAGKWRE